MSVPLTPDQFVAALRAEGLEVVLVGDWRTHNRNHKGAWGPVNGVMIHHTVSRGDVASVELCRRGYAELPGPLCHVVIGKSGTAYVISVGRSNHAGGGDPNVLQAVIDERYGDRPPVPRVGNATGVDGNARFYGAECVNLGDGKDPWPAVQVDAMVRFSAALSRAHRWTEKSTIAHREWSSDKPDPAGPGMPSMPEFRARVGARLAHAPSWSPGTGVPVPDFPLPDNPYPGDELMPYPNLSVLAREEDTTLFPDTPVRLYWTSEHTDEGGDHGSGGKTVLDGGGKYSATLNLRVEGLGDNETVKVYPVEEDATGALAGIGDVHEIEGRGNPALPVQTTTTINGRVYNRLSFEVVNTSSATVTLTRATLAMHSWPL